MNAEPHAPLVAERTHPPDDSSDIHTYCTPTPGAVRFQGNASATPAPTAAPVGEFGPGVPHTVQLARDSFVVEWDDFGAGANRDVVTYSVVVSGDNGSVLAQSHGIPADTRQASFSGLYLSVGIPLFAVVTATNSTGNSISTQSLRPLVVDVSPPQQGHVPSGAAVAAGVYDGPSAGKDWDCQPRSGAAVLDPAVYTVASSFRGGHGVEVSPVALGLEVMASGMLASSALESTVLTVSIDPFEDPESGVAHMRVCVGSTPGGEDVMAWTAVPRHAPTVQLILPMQQVGSILHVIAASTQLGSRPKPGVTASACSANPVLPGVSLMEYSCVCKNWLPLAFSAMRRCMAEFQ